MNQALQRAVHKLDAVDAETAGKEKQISLTREELPIKYAECVAQNPLLARIEATGRSLGWSDEEIRTYQMLTVCVSNASLMRRLRELELGITVKK